MTTSAWIEAKAELRPSTPRTPRSAAPTGSATLPPGLDRERDDLLAELELAQPHGGRRSDRDPSGPLSWSARCATSGTTRARRRQPLLGFHRALHRLRRRRSRRPGELVRLLRAPSETSTTPSNGRASPPRSSACCSASARSGFADELVTDLEQLLGRTTNRGYRGCSGLPPRAEHSFEDRPSVNATSPTTRNTSPTTPIETEESAVYSVRR